MNQKFLIFILLYFTCLSVQGQEIGLTGSRLFSSNYELQEPYGFGIIIAFPSNRSMKIKFEFNNHQNTREYSGPLVRGFLPGPPEEELVQSQSKKNSYEISLNKSLIRSASFNLYLSFGVHSDKFAVFREGLQTGKIIELSSEKKWGYLLAVQSEIPLIKNFHLNGYGTIKIKRFFKSSFILDAENPFENLSSLYEIQFGFLLKI